MARSQKAGDTVQGGALPQDGALRVEDRAAALFVRDQARALEN
jgi:hypothetical protein